VDFLKDKFVKRVLLYAFLVCFVLLHIYVKLWTKPFFESAGNLAGQIATPFEGATLDNNKAQLASVLKGHKLVILDFWESWCGPCRLEMPEFQNLYSAYTERGVEMIGVYNSSSDESVKQSIKEYSLTFPMIHDNDGTISKSFRVEAVPTTFVIGPDLKILRSHQGMDGGLRTFIEAQLNSRVHKTR